MSAPDWIRHTSRDRLAPDSYGSMRDGALSDAEEVFLDSRDDAITLVETSDPDGSYSYDDWALCEIRGTFWVFSTSGCSCPSPDETWTLETHGTRDDVIAFFNGPGKGYRSSGEEEFRRALAKLGWPVTTVEAGRRFDW